MLRFLIPVGIVGLGLMIYSFIECIQTPRHRVRVLGKAAWLAVIALVPILGAGLWLGFGRAQGGKNGGSVPKQGPTAPDDDPEFLRKVEIQRRQRQRAQDQREKDEDLKRREREIESRKDRSSENGAGGAGTENGTGAESGAQSGTDGASGNDGVTETGGSLDQDSAEDLETGSEAEEDSDTDPPRG